MCVQLVQELQAHHACLPVGNPRGLEHAYIAAIQAASNAEEDENGTLDRSMTRVLRGIEPGCTKVRRIQVIDALCNHLQAAQILAKQATEDALGTELMEAEIQDVDIAEEKDKQGETRTLTLQLDNMAREVSHHAVSRKHAAHVIAGALAVAMDLSWVDGIHLFDPVLDPKRLAPAQLEKLRALQETFQQEYRVRRQMLIKRVGVTLQSFVCSTRIAENKAEVEGAVEKAMERMKVAPSVSWEDMHRVTHYDLIMMGQRTSFGSQDSFVSSVKSVLMGAVPDRGGRPGDRRAARSYVGGGHWRHDCTLGLVHTTSTTQAKDGTTPIQAQKCARCNERLMEGDIAQSHASCGDVPSSWNAIDLEDGGVPHLVQDRTKGQAVDQCTQYQEVNLERARSITGTTTRSPTMKESWWLSCGHL